MKNDEALRRTQLGLLSVTGILLVVAPALGSSPIKRMSFLILLTLGLLLAAKALRYQLKQK